MAAEGMVHALETIHALLMPGGWLVDIHDAAEPPEIWLHAGATEAWVGYLLETDHYTDYAQAEDALARVQVRGYYRLEQRQRFLFKTHAESFDELSEFIRTSWSDAELLPQVRERADMMKAQLGAVHSATLQEVVHILRLNKVG